MVVLMGVVARVMVIDLPNDPVPRPFRDDERGIDVNLLDQPCTSCRKL